MLSDFMAIAEAKILSEGMGDQRDELLADLESSGRRELFEDAVQILIAQADAVQTPDEAFALADNIYRLAHETAELEKRLFGNVPGGAPLYFTNRTKAKVAASEAEKKKSRQEAAGIEQRLLRVVVDKKPLETNDPQTLFDKIMAKLGYQRIQ